MAKAKKEKTTAAEKAKTNQIGLEKARLRRLMRG